MKRIIFFTSLILLSSCFSKDLPAEQSETSVLPLYSHVEWSHAKDSQRLFAYEGTETLVSGLETYAVYDGDMEVEGEMIVDRFWEYFLAGDSLKNLGYEEIFVLEEEFDRQFVGLRNKEGNIILISSITDFDFVDESEEIYECPCIFTFKVFTDDERVQLK
ncbi:hypothetical protein KJ652_04800 [Patescibacteria group bacterium]|nr:hypothetical protein [Patescibacteria group bacterium]MBU1123884.1 hypothetical protein [Patescibacteria group bacterium]MBU1910990.1 hypothetical protein [Patescibacteria group bacterium]